MKKSNLKRASSLALMSVMTVAFTSVPAMAADIEKGECSTNSVSGDNVGTAPSGATAPGASDRYKNKINNAKLQIGDASDTCYEAGDEIGDVNAYNDHFYLEDDSKLANIVFKESGAGFRSELRVEDNFNVGSNAGNNYVRSKNDIRDTGGVDELTVLQVHAVGARGPLARLNWAAEGVQDEAHDRENDNKEGFWLTIRKDGSCSSGSNGCINHVFLGNWTGSKYLRLGVWDDKLRVKVGYQYKDISDVFGDADENGGTNSDGLLLTNSEWSDGDFYLKAGAYINIADDDDGEVEVVHKFLKFFAP